MSLMGKVGIVVAMMAALMVVVAIKGGSGKSCTGGTCALPAPGAAGSVAVKPPAPENSVRLPRLVDVGSTTCIPCKMMAPILDELKAGYKGRLDVSFVDVAKDRSAWEPFGISTIPTQIFFDAGGKELYRHEGFIPKQDILAKWKELGFDLEKGASSAKAQ